MWALCRHELSPREGRKSADPSSGWYEASLSSPDPPGLCVPSPGWGVPQGAAGAGKVLDTGCLSGAWQGSVCPAWWGLGRGGWKHQLRTGDKWGGGRVCFWPLGRLRAVRMDLAGSVLMRSRAVRGFEPGVWKEGSILEGFMEEWVHPSRVGAGPLPKERPNAGIRASTPPGTPCSQPRDGE